MENRKLFIGIDLALRKTGITCFDSNKKLITFNLNVCPLSYKDEDILIYNTTCIMNFIDLVCNTYNIKDSELSVFIEGLSFNSLNQQSDLIAANHWCIRTEIKRKYSNVLLNIMSPQSWKSKLFSKEDKEKIKEYFPIIRAKRGMKLNNYEQKLNNKQKAKMRTYVKDLIISKVPDDIINRFNDYITENKINKDCISDLCDSYNMVYVNIG